MIPLRRVSRERARWECGKVLALHVALAALLTLAALLALIGLLALTALLPLAALLALAALLLLLLTGVLLLAVILLLLRIAFLFVRHVFSDCCYRASAAHRASDQPGALTICSVFSEA